MSEPDLTAELDAAEVIVMGGTTRHMAAYVAPAARVLTVLHRPGPDYLPAGVDALTGVPADGWTACGTPCLVDEIWMPVERRPGDRICPDCEASVNGEAASGDVQEALL